MQEDYDFERELFISNCLILEKKILQLCDIGFSDREICSVLVTIIANIANKQENAEKAFDQIVLSIKKRIGTDNDN